MNNPIVGTECIDTFHELAFPQGNPIGCRNHRFPLILELTALRPLRSRNEPQDNASS